MKQTALVTGSNRGIGLELCRQLKQNGFQVIATCRQRSTALDDLNVEIIEDILARHPRYISSWDIHVLRFIPLGRLN